MSVHIVIGTIQKEIEFGKTNGGTSLAKMSIPEKRQTSNGDKTFWYNVTAYGKTAEFIQKNFRKGTIVELMVQPDMSEGTNGKTYLNWSVLPVIGAVKPIANFGGQQNSSLNSAPQGVNQNNQTPAPTPPAYDPAQGDDDDVPF